MHFVTSQRALHLSFLKDSFMSQVHCCGPSTKYIFKNTVALNMTSVSMLETT